MGACNLSYEHHREAEDQKWQTGIPSERVNKKAS